MAPTTKKDTMYNYPGRICYSDVPAHSRFKQLDTTRLGKKPTKFYDDDYSITSSLAELSNYRQGFLISQRANYQLFITSLFLSKCCYRTKHIAKASSFDSVADIKTKAHQLAGKVTVWLRGLGREV